MIVQVRNREPVKLTAPVVYEIQRRAGDMLKLSLEDFLPNGVAIPYDVLTLEVLQITSQVVAEVARWQDHELHAELREKLRTRWQQGKAT